MMQAQADHAIVAQVIAKRAADEEQAQAAKRPKLTDVPPPPVEDPEEEKKLEDQEAHVLQDDEKEMDKDSGDEDEHDKELPGLEGAEGTEGGDLDKKRTMQWSDECDMMLTENMARNKQLKHTYAFGSGHNTKGQRLAIVASELVKESPEFKALDGPNGGIQINTRLRILYKQWCNQLLVATGAKGKKARTCWHVPRRTGDVSARHARVGAQFDEMMDAFADYLDQKDQKKKGEGKKYFAKRRPHHLKWNSVNSLLQGDPVRMPLPSGLPSVQSNPTYIPSNTMNGAIPLGGVGRIPISTGSPMAPFTPTSAGPMGSPMNNVNTPVGLDMAKKRAELELVQIKIQREREELKAMQAKREDKKKLLKKLISDLNDQVELGIFSETEKNERLKVAADKLNDL